jgi:hypothetical protein
MATDVGSLALGLDGHMVTLWFGRKGLRTTWGNQVIIFHFFIVDCLVIAFPKISIP